jgi:TPR repeat protein
MFRLPSAATALLFLTTLAAHAADSGYRDGVRAYAAGNFAAAGKSWQRAAQGGNRRAQYRLGLMLIHGIGVERRPKAGRDWLEQAATAGSVPAQLELSLALFGGQVLEQDYAAALRWAGAAAGTGDPEGIHYVARHYDRGLGVALDYGKARELFRAAAEAGWPAAQRSLANYLHAGVAGDVDRAQALSWWQRAAAQGDGEALFHLGESYRLGQGVAEDQQIARTYFRRSAEAGDGRAQHNLAVYLLQNRDNGDNIKEGEFWLQRAAAGGLAASQLMLARRMLRDANDPARVVAAFEWLGRSFRKGWPAARQQVDKMKAELAEALATGSDPQSSSVSQAAMCLLTFEAQKWELLNGACEDPAGSGNTVAQVVMARSESAGLGRPVNHANARTWFARAARSGLPLALNALGRNDLQDAASPRQKQAGVVLIRRAAELGYAPAQFNLAYMYERGIVLPANTVAAVSWYRRAADAGHARAQFNLASHLLREDGFLRNQERAMVWLILSGIPQGVDRKEGQDVALRADRLRRQLEALMTPSQIDVAKRRAIEFRPRQ